LILESGCVRIAGWISMNLRISVGYARPIDLNTQLKMIFGGAVLRKVSKVLDVNSKSMKFSKMEMKTYQNIITKLLK
jgi:hypothetical protein